MLFEPKQRSWNNGAIQLFCGPAGMVLPLLADQVDALITDPPYGINLQPQRKKTKAIANDVQRYSKAIFGGLLPDIERLVKFDTAHLVFGGWSESWLPQMLSEWFTVKSTIVWKKNNFGIGYYTRPQHEFIYYLHNGQPEKPAKAISDVWEFKKVYRPIHSCQKPVELMEQCITFTTHECATVLDPFAGSGSTLIAAMRTNRRCIGIEADPETFQLASERISAAEAERGQ